VATSAQPTDVILIADGDAVARKKLARVFGRAGFATVQAATAPDELLARVRRLVQRAPPVALTVPTLLTKREFEVLGLLAEGLAQREIAQRLAIREKTVGSHIERTLSKLGVRSRAQAVALAFREDLVGASKEASALSLNRQEDLAHAAPTT
jgi:DNA-binding CsgD family transcriptional regulator